MERLAKVAIAFLLVFTLIGGQSTYAEATVVTVDTNVLNMRSGPGLTYEVIDSLKRGDQVTVLSSSGDWLQVQSGNKTGWVAQWLTAKKREGTAHASMIVSQVNSLNVRAEPSIGSAILARMSAGDEAVMTDQKDDWIRVSFKGVSGWVHEDYIAEVAETDVGNASKEETGAETFTVAVDALNVRKEADLSSKRIELIHKNETYTVLKTNGNWVQISLTGGQVGWVYAFHGNLNAASGSSQENPSAKQVTVLSDGTNIREAATTSSQVVHRANAGEQFAIIKEAGDWYEVTLSTGATAFVAKWVVSTDGTEPMREKSEPKKARVPGTLQGVTVVIDPGHGGNDRGTTGKRGTDEKNITLLTSELLASKLKAAGATVHLTRESDEYVTLRKRVAVSHQYTADAFISIHYDATIDPSVSGFTTYYTHHSHQALADAVNRGLGAALSIRNRGAQPADYFVLRENRQNAILLELGFLSNPLEERIVTTERFREQATHGIYNGLLQYFNDSLD